MLSSFTIENYRAFALEQTIEIRPLTLFFGWNSGGKSALLRFLPLLVESIKADGQTISLAGDVGRNATWPELVCKATKRTNLKFSLQWTEEPVRATWEVDGDLAGKWQETRTVRVTNKSEITTFPIPETVYGWEGYPNTGGDLANITNEHRIDILNVSNNLKKLTKNVQWIAGVRVRPPRVVIYGGGNPTTLKSDGTNAVDHLIAATLRSTNDPVLEATRLFFSALGEQLVLDNPLDGVWRVMLRPNKALDVMVNICDTGEGYAQVLPVLVALARARFGGPRLLCLEQPELHLHTRAQLELANILVQTALAESQPSILVETHSEVLLTSIQLAIANGEIAHDKVRVYWIESLPDGTSEAMPVDFDIQGLPTNATLVDAFSEAVELGRKLMLRQLAGQVL
jgi:predicted ATPase